MTREEWKNVMLGAFAAAGWFYAIMLTRKEVFDVWHSATWYEMLLISVVGFLVIIPAAIWLRVRFWGRPKSSRPDLPSPAPEDT